MSEGFAAFAQSEFELGVEVEGQPLIEHLLSYERQTGRAHPTLANAPVLVEELDQLWRDFLALHKTRGSSGFGPASISYHDIDAYQRVEGFRFKRWQIDAIRKADEAYIRVRAEQNKPAGRQ